MNLIYWLPAGTAVVGGIIGYAIKHTLLATLLGAGIGGALGGLALIVLIGYALRGLS